MIWLFRIDWCSHQSCSDDKSRLWSWRHETCFCKTISYPIIVSKWIVRILFVESSSYHLSISFSPSFSYKNGGISVVCVLIFWLRAFSFLNECLFYNDSVFHLYSTGSKKRIIFFCKSSDTSELKVKSTNGRVTNIVLFCAQRHRRYLTKDNDWRCTHSMNSFIKNIYFYKGNKKQKQ